MQEKELKNSMSGKERIKILFVTHWAQRLGGAELSLLDIMTEACKKADIYLVTSENGLLVESAKNMGIKCTIIPCNKEIENIRRDKMVLSLLKNIRFLFSFFLYVYKFYRHVSCLKPDIIHANVPKSHITLSLSSWLYDDCIFIFHLREIFKRSSFSAALYRFLLPAKNFMVIAVSEAVKRDLPPRIKKNTVVLYNGIKIPEQLPPKKPQQKVAFLYLGRIVPWKGCHLLIDAFYLLYQKTGDLCGTLDLVGDTIYWDQSYRKSLADKVNRLNLTEKIRLKPHTSDLQQAFHSHDVLCMASENEPFGRVAIEAMSHGLPVISFESGGICEVVKHGISGFLVEQNNIKAFAETMEMFIHNPDMIVAMGKSGYQITKENFDRERNIPVIIDKMISLLE